MRVITGSARGKKLETLEGTQVIRPTSDGVKEAMFSAVQFFIPGARVLDMFAGCGQLGIEALSCGASLCVFVDISRESAAVVIRNLKSVGMFSQARVITGDSIKYAKGAKDSFDIIIIDPPYRMGLAQQAVECASAIASEGARVICETEFGCEMPQQAGELELVKKYKHGKTALWLYKKPSPDDTETTGAEE